MPPTIASVVQTQFSFVTTKNDTLSLKRDKASQRFVPMEQGFPCNILQKAVITSFAVAPQM